MNDNHTIHKTTNLCKKITNELERKESILNEQEIVVVGANILVTPAPDEKQSVGGIIIPETKKDAPHDLVSGAVRQVGPGFMVPESSKDSGSVEDLIAYTEYQGRPSMKHIPMDINIGDMVFYYKQAGDEIELLGYKYVIVPYGAIKVLLRQKV